MGDKRSKEEATKEQGEAQVEHADSASVPDKNMETEGLLARNNPHGSAREADDDEQGRPNSVR